MANLAVLCLDCHRETQIAGGFDRKLDAEQVLLYRDDWCRIVAEQRVLAEAGSRRLPSDVELDSELAAIYRRNEEYGLLAIHYDVLGNEELRDKYIELALSRDPDDSLVVFLRGLQKRPDLVPEQVADREFRRLTQERSWLQRARFHRSLGRAREAVADYTRGINEALRAKKVFSAAYYLKELTRGNLSRDLFLTALDQARKDGDLWWQVRALQELGWDTEVHDLLLKHESEIELGDNRRLKMLLAGAKGDLQRARELEKEMARDTHRLVTR